jgi:hypothetical protein
MKSKPNITFGMHNFQQNTGEVTMSGDTDKINGFTRCTIRQLLLGVHTSRRFLENWQERTRLLHYLKGSYDLWQLTKVNAKMNTGERLCESLCTEINSLKMESRGGLTRTLFTDVSESTLISTLMMEVAIFSETVVHIYYKTTRCRVPGYTNFQSHRWQSFKFCADVNFRLHESGELFWLGEWLAWKWVGE